MRLTVSIKYATTPNGVPFLNTPVTDDFPSDRISDIKEQIKKKHPGWYNIQINTPPKRV